VKKTFKSKFKGNTIDFDEFVIHEEFKSHCLYDDQHPSVEGYKLIAKMANSICED